MPRAFFLFFWGGEMGRELLCLWIGKTEGISASEEEQRMEEHGSLFTVFSVIFLFKLHSILDCSGLMSEMTNCPLKRWIWDNVNLQKNK